VKASVFVQKPGFGRAFVLVSRRLWHACDTISARAPYHSTVRRKGDQMRSTGTSTEIRETSAAADDHLEVVLTGTDGNDTKLRLSADTAAGLAAILGEFVAKSAVRSVVAALTKRPKTFAVGTGRFEPVVLLRFENDAPYALGPELAMELCEALLEASASAIAQPAQVLQ
jgi:hypothetical protein